MPAPLRVTLNEEEARTLRELRRASSVAYRVRERAHIIQLNAQGCNTPELAKMFECCEHTVRSTLKRWEDGGLGGLWDACGRGRKPRWQEADMEYLEQCLEVDECTYNSEQLADKLLEERHVKLSPDRIRRVLRKRGGVGNAPVRATNPSKTQSKKLLNKPT